jgi:hypothetical protein
MDNSAGSTGGTPERPRDDTAPRDESALTGDTGAGSGGMGSTGSGGEGGSGTPYSPYSGGTGSTGGTPSGSSGGETPGLSGEDAGALYRPAYGETGSGTGASSGFGSGGGYTSGSGSQPDALSGGTGSTGGTPSEGGARAYSTPGDKPTPPYGEATYTPYTPPPTPPAPSSEYGSIGESARASQPPYTPPGEPARAMPPDAAIGAGAQPYGAPGAPGVPPQGYTPPPGQYQQGYPQQPHAGQPSYPQPGYPQQGYPQPGYPQQPGGYGPPQPTYTQAPPAEKKGGVPAIVWIIGGVLIATIIGCIIVALMVGAFFNRVGSSIEQGLGEAGPSIAAIGFTAAMTFGQYDDAHNYLGGDLATRWSASTLEQRWEELSGDGTSLGVENQLGDPRSLGSNRSSIDWIVTTPQGDETIELVIEEQGTEWKIVEARPDLLP